MLHEYKPLSRAELEPKQKYLWLHVSEHGIMMLANIMALEFPHCDEEFTILYVYDSGKYLRPCTYFELGCMPNALGVRSDNRVFVNSDCLHDQLLALVRTQDYAAWQQYLQQFQEPAVVRLRKTA